MRSVGDTARKPECTFNAIGQITECTSTNTRLPLPSPNHINANGSKAMAGNGFRSAQSKSSRSAPMRVVAAKPASSMARTMPMAYP